MIKVVCFFVDAGLVFADVFLAEDKLTVVDALFVIVTASSRGGQWYIPSLSLIEEGSIASWQSAQCACLRAVTLVASSALES
jgi:predicted Kef-type K+ transport protein